VSKLSAKVFFLKVNYSFNILYAQKYFLRMFLSLFLIKLLKRKKLTVSINSNLS